jgi:hypothetical protein
MASDQDTLLQIIIPALFECFDRKTVLLQYEQICHVLLLIDLILEVSPPLAHNILQSNFVAYLVTENSLFLEKFGIQSVSMSVDDVKT